jgi:phage shock protein A
VAAAEAAASAAHSAAAAASVVAAVAREEDGGEPRARAQAEFHTIRGSRLKEESMAQTSILGRIGQLVRANVNAILDSAEDPEKMLDQLVRDFTNNIAEAEEAVAQTIGNLRLVEDDAREAREASADWLSKATAASRRADELRGEGNASEANRFDDLAKIALRRQISYEEQAKTLETQASQQTELADKLKDGLNKLRVKREELVQKRDELVSRAKMAQAQSSVQATIKSVSVMDPTSEISRFEERVRRQEAMVRGMEEVAASSLEEQFDSLEDAGEELEVEARLAELKRS